MSKPAVLVRRGDPSIAIVYVHGYGTDAAEAFARVAPLVARGATLIVPAAPGGRDQPVAFPALSDVLTAAGVPGARTMAIGHSGGYRTLKHWLPSPQLHEVALLDAAYSPDAFAEWAALPGRKLHIVGGDSTRPASKALAARAGVPYIEGGGHQEVVAATLPMLSRQWRPSPWLWALVAAAVGWAVWMS